MAKKQPKKPRLADVAKATRPTGVKAEDGAGMTVEGDGDRMTVVCRTKTVRTLDELLAAVDADPKVWEVERWVANKWDTVAKCNVPGESDRFPEHELRASELWQVKAWFRRKSPERRGLEALIEELKSHSPIVPTIKRTKARKGAPRRALEVCIMDPHLGLECFRPGSDHAWNLGECERFYHWAIDGLLERAAPYGPFQEVLWVFGNDYLHSDNVFHTTTQGTPQPDSMAWHTIYERGVKLAISAADKLKTVAPLRVLQIPGNHDRQSSYTLGWVLWAYYHNDKNVTVECSPMPRRFWEWGVNLIGFDHGHSVNVNRLAGLMANSCREAWARTAYREMHLGDQHRRGGGRPVMMTEQGVGVEFLTGLTPGNEWHSIKGFLWSQRGAVAYVWDAATGPEARLHVNINSYTGKPMGEMA